MFNLDPTPFDVRLTAFGIPIRVHPSFWIGMTVLGWNENHLQFTFIWVMCGFFSILVHELGHAVTAEWFGWPTEIILYFGGGLAASRRDRNNTEWRNIAVALMGPVAGFLLLSQVMLVVYLLERNDIFIGEYGYVTYAVLYYINLYWGLVNLLPALPLDGGHVFQSVCALLGFRDPVHITLNVGAFVAGVAAYYFFARSHNNYAGLLMLMICFQNVTALQSRR